MSLDSNTHPLDELAVYALDALEVDEQAVVEQHLGACAPCRAELDRHRETLAHLTTPEAPPSHVWDRIAETIDRDRGRRGRHGRTVPFGSPDSLDPDIPRHRAPRPRRNPTVWLGGLAAAAAIAVVAGVGTLLARGDDRADSVEDLALAAADDPDSEIVHLLADDGRSQARVVLAADGAGYVLFDDLPRLARGRSYQLWKVEGTARPVSLGVLGDGGKDAAAFALPAGTTGFALSEEADSGVPEPTGPIVATGSRT